MYIPFVVSLSNRMRPFDRLRANGVRWPFRSAFSLQRRFRPSRQTTP